GREHDRHRGRCRFGGKRSGSIRDDHSRLEADQISQKTRQPIISPFGPALLDRDVAPVDKASLAQALAKRSHYVIKGRRRCVAKKADDRHRRLLRLRHERPRRRAANQRDELAALHLRGHSITSSASESRLSEILMPSAFAVLRLITVSNL